MHVPHTLRRTTGALLAAAAIGCDAADRISEPISSPSNGLVGQFKFTPLASSATCQDNDGDQPFVLPTGYAQTIIAREGDGGAPDLWDMNTQNETGPEAGRFLYGTHELTANAAVWATDLTAGTTTVLAQRSDWERFDGIVWTPWGTILAAEEVSEGRTNPLFDANAPQAKGGLVYEINPVSGEAVVRPAIGSRSHEGLRFDSQGNLYGISESSPTDAISGGYIYSSFRTTR